MINLKTRTLTYNVYILTLSMLVMAMVFAISFILPPKLHAEEMGNTIVANNQTYLQKTVIESNKNVVTLKKIDVMPRSSSTQISFAQALGMTQPEYDSLQDQKKLEYENAESIYIEEVYTYDINNEGGVQAMTSVPDYDADNGYMKIRFSVVDTGSVDIENNKILIFGADYIWNKIPYQRRKDVYALAWDTSRFIQQSQPSAYLSWDYFLSPDKVTPGGPAMSGSMNGFERDDDIWNKFLDTEYYITASGSNHYVTADLPNKTHYFTPSGIISLGFSKKVIDTGSGSFMLWTNYGHDQGAFAANKPSIEFSYRNISISATLSAIKEYTHCTNAIYL